MNTIYSDYMQRKYKKIQLILSCLPKHFWWTAKSISKHCPFTTQRCAYSLDFAYKQNLVKRKIKKGKYYYHS